ncbi:MAG TPA: NAD(P)H-dependent glycerol-3-phosphate dehydrogenase [bacterium]|nr:NAD(P)H-dependent glycerol-3-phosphate dehydrogenase [bacterium]
MKLCVLGGGSWGIALSVHLKRAGHDLTLWEFDKVKAKELDEKRENPVILPGITLPRDITVTDNMEKALAGREGVVVVVPSHVVRSTAKTAASFWPKGAWVTCAAKGLEEETHLRMSEVLKQNLNSNVSIGVLSGPSHAEEVSRQMPTTVVSASADKELAVTVQKAFHSDYFRVYTSTDVVGIELGASLKNVIAIAAGITDGLGLGDNAKAALMTRGLHEITRLGLAFGAQAKTFAGLAGMGDLIVTCTSRHSRNRLLGEKIGKGATLEQALKEMVMVAEGVKSSKAAVALAREAKVEVPITEEVYKVLFEGKKAKEAVISLLSRAAKPEQDFA